MAQQLDVLRRAGRGEHLEVDVRLRRDYLREIARDRKVGTALVGRDDLVAGRAVRRQPVKNARSQCREQQLSYDFHEPYRPPFGMQKPSAAVTSLQAGDGASAPLTGCTLTLLVARSAGAGMRTSSFVGLFVCVTHGWRLRSGAAAVSSGVAGSATGVVRLTRTGATVSAALASGASFGFAAAGAAAGTAGAVAASFNFGTT